MTAVIAAAGQTRFGAHPGLGIKELFAGALDDLLATADNPIDVARIDAAYVGSLSAGQGMQLGNLAAALMDYAGLPPVPALHVENACASGGYALHEAVMAVESGRYRCVLAAGVEKMRDVSGDRGRYWLGISGDTEYERLAGLTFAGVFALMASRLIADGLVTREDLARVAVKNHRHALGNPLAHLRREVTLEQVVASPSVASPLGGLDCCPTTDGAACVLVVDAGLASELTEQPSVVAGWGGATDKLALHSRKSPARLPAVAAAAATAYSTARVGPQDLDLVEAHDCFTVAELIAYAELGLCAIEDAGAELAGGAFDLGGRVPVNASGGLKAKGHPIGATGVAQVVELHRQLRGEAQSPERQVPGARVALAQNVGGSGASAAVTILRRPS
jgi:acetyl-CoA C-acetyltransferase/acetyl-CoA acyltransferase